MDDGTPGKGEAIRLSATASYAYALQGKQSGAVGTYTWDVGADGTVESTVPDLTHVFAEPGEYRIRLTVTDQKNRSGRDEILVRVH